MVHLLQSPSVLTNNGALKEMDHSFYHLTSERATPFIQ